MTKNKKNQNSKMRMNTANVTKIPKRLSAWCDESKLSLQEDDEYGVFKRGLNRLGPSKKIHRSEIGGNYNK